MRSSKVYLEAIREKLSTFDKNGASLLCTELMADLYASAEMFDTKDGEQIMQQLRNKRMFKEMMQAGDAFIQTGRYTYKIHKLYAQALIDQNILTAALSVLADLIKATENNPAPGATAENIEARGLTGRIYKQLYVNAARPAAVHNQQFIKEAIRRYYDVYAGNPNTCTWHGINAVALLYRAQKDGIGISDFPAYEQVAGEIVQTITDKYAEQRADAWDFATAGEACLALNRLPDALEWLSGYARMPYCDAFELASTLRQLEEVWQLDAGSEGGKMLLPILRAELLQREGGNVLLNASDLQKQMDTEEQNTAQYAALKKQSTEGGKPVLEKVFGDESFKTYKWYTTGANRCLAVARIGRDSSKGFGTGFLLQGKALCEALAEELILITNAHVVSSNPADNALQPYEAIILFEALDRDAEFKAEKILWSSPATELDATILRFSKEDQERLKELTKGIKTYSVNDSPPATDSSPAQRVYIIGHPFGGTLQLSFQDNALLDYERPKIHYRTPTVGGSSGSPVFDQQWNLIGLHHAGSDTMPCLNNKPGTYEANEGIWIQAIKETFCSQFVP